MWIPFLKPNHDMRHPFDLDDFEAFLSEQSDRHRLYAEDQVWRNIQTKLHGKDRWPALTFGSILTIAIIAVGLTLYYPNKNLIDQESLIPVSDKNTKTLLAQTATHTAKSQSEATSLAPKTSSLQIESGIFFNPAKEIEIAKIEPSVLEESSLTLSDENALVNNLDNAEAETGNALFEMEEISPAKKTTTVSAITGLPAGNEKHWEIIQQHFQIQPLQVLDDYAKPAMVLPNMLLMDTVELEVFKKTTMAYGPAKSKPIAASKSKLALQLYATPSISYRYLLEDRSFSENQLNGPLAPNLTNSVNAFVRHQPKMGFEIGAALLFKLSDNFRFKTGLQFNHRQFGISAYSLLQYEPALFALNGANGVDSMISYTRISAQNGQSPLDLTSNFFQVAVPVGFDMKISQVKNVDFYVSASGQLTYNLSSSSYLLSTDFKKYVPQPHNLDRRFNINTAVEAFASFQMGGVNWQVGPQIRYQMLPGSKSAYPIREHLIDYGVKIGVVKTLK